METRVYLSFVCASVLCVLCVGQDTLKYQIYEESSINTFIGNVGQDSNLRATVLGVDFIHLRYTLLPKTDGAGQYFRIDSNDGSLFTAALIDRESLPACASQPACVLTVSVAVRSQTSAYFRLLSIEVTILDINDNSPVFPRPSVTLEISEAAAVGSSLALPAAVDRDSGNLSLLSYTIRAAADLPFSLEVERHVDDSVDPKLRVTSKLDREAVDAYHFLVVAEDGGQPARTATLHVTVNIVDANDNYPIFSQALYHVTVNETLPVGTTFLTVVATDADKGDNATVRYSLIYNPLFSIDVTSGTLGLKTRLESRGEHRLVVKARDRGRPQLSSQTVVIVTVVDPNNPRPQIGVIG